MTKKSRWWLGVIGAVAVATIGGAAAVAVSKRSAEAEEAKKREQPPLEFAAADVVRLQPKRLTVELALPGSVQAVSQATGSATHVVPSQWKPAPHAGSQVTGLATHVVPSQ